MDKQGDDINGRQYLINFLKVTPLSLALWRAVEALAFSQVKLKRPILDLGCGFGEFAGVVFDRMEVGVDINKKDLKKALKGDKYKKIQWADARKLPFRDESFSTIFSVSVLEHIKGAEKALEEAKRVLRKDGLFAFTVPTPSMYNHMVVPKVCSSLGFQNLGEKYFEIYNTVFKHITLKSAKWWEKQLKKAGFEIIIQEGTLSPWVMRLFEIFLVTALPCQITKLLFGKRIPLSAGIRSKVLPFFFQKFVYLDRDSDINVFFLCRKK